jgi:hypothetical protein
MSLVPRETDVGYQQQVSASTVSGNGNELVLAGIEARLRPIALKLGACT